jgi:hypothetical protein
VLGPVRRWSILGSVAAAAVVGVVLVGGLIGRAAPSPTAHGSASARPGQATPAAPTPAASTPLSSAPITGCDTLHFDARRCAAVVAKARERAANPVGVISVFVGPPDRRGGVLLGGGGAPIANVDFTLADGTHERADVICTHSFGGIISDRACSADPQIRLFGGVSTDTPCGPNPCGEGNAGATPPPSPKPAVVAASTPLVLRILDVPLDHVGHYEVFAGNAWLPDGLLTERSGSIGDPRPTTYWVDQGITIEVRPVPPCPGGCPATIESIYHRPFHGPQPVRVYLVFDVVELSVPGTILEIRNLVVR